MAYNVNADPKQLRGLDDELKACYSSIYKATDNLRDSVDRLKNALDDEAYMKSKVVIDKTLQLLEAYQPKFKSIDRWLLDYAAWLEKL